MQAKDFACEPAGLKVVIRVGIAKLWEMKTDANMRILHKLIGKAGFVPFFPPIFGRAHDFCVSLMDKKDEDSDCSLPRFRTGETDEPHDDSMSVGDLSDMESEWDPCETPGQLPEEFQDEEVNSAACVLTGTNSAHFQMISHGFAESMGWFKQELQGKQVIRLLSADLWTQYQLDCAYNKAIEEGGKQSIEAALRCKTGELKFCRVTMEKVVTSFNGNTMDVLLMTSHELD